MYPLGSADRLVGFEAFEDVFNVIVDDKVVVMFLAEKVLLHGMIEEGQ